MSIESEPQAPEQEEPIEYRLRVEYLHVPATAPLQSTIKTVKNRTSKALKKHALNASSRAAKLRLARRTSSRASRSGIANSIVSQAKKMAKKMDSTGLCYRGVKRALKPLGIVLEGNAAWMAKNQLFEDGRFETVSVKALQPGDILVHQASKAHKYGHIAVYLGNGREASDHIQKVVIGGRYGRLTVFRAKDTSLFAGRPSTQTAG